ncbi:potassium voltage-gated channel subfamily H member 5 isoform X3 [Babesia caballi]|uniref:Potassium voltage-gated channel subfamily H member 5 isoform X3 n=1 Tax=Babesia caballi TaxID=5871 RepID=A0AAV4M2C4_BABCB|nr:potassium voltage-gated channel subfamily H member 5 isoform X3 [Babesia caballi]
MRDLLNYKHHVVVLETPAVQLGNLLHHGLASRRIQRATFARLEPRARHARLESSVYLLQTRLNCPTYVHLDQHVLPRAHRLQGADQAVQHELPVVHHHPHISHNHLQQRPRNKVVVEQVQHRLSAPAHRAADDVVHPLRELGPAQRKGPGAQHTRLVERPFEGGEAPVVPQVRERVAHLELVPRRRHDTPQPKNALPGGEVGLHELREAGIESVRAQLRRGAVQHDGRLEARLGGEQRRRARGQQ